MATAIQRTTSEDPTEKATLLGCLEFWKRHLKEVNERWEAIMPLMVGIGAITGGLVAYFGLPQAEPWIPTLVTWASAGAMIWAVIYSILWLPYKCVYELESKHRDTVSGLKQQLIGEDWETRKKEAAKINRDTLGVCLKQIEAQIYAIQEMDPIGYARTLDATLRHQPSDDLINGVCRELRAQHSIAEEAYFNNLTTDFVPPTVQRNTISKVFYPWQWQVARLKFHAKRLEEIIQKHP